MKLFKQLLSFFILLQVLHSSVADASVYTCKNVFRVDRGDLSLFSYPKNKSFVRLQNKKGQQTSRKIYKEMDAELVTQNLKSKELITTPFRFFTRRHSDPSEVKPLLFIFPSSFGVTFVEYMVMRYFVSRGFNVVMYEYSRPPGDVTLPIKDFEASFVEAVTHARQIFDGLIERGLVQESNIHVWGSSLGAFLTNTLYNVEPRVRSAVSIAGGGYLADIFTETKNTAMQKYRKVRIEEEGLKDINEFRQKFRSHFRADPALYAYLRSGENNIKFAIAEKDTIVIAKYQNDLVNLYDSGTLSQVRITSDHLTAILKAHYPMFMTFAQHVLDRAFVSREDLNQ